MHDDKKPSFILDEDYTTNFHTRWKKESVASVGTITIEILWAIFSPTFFIHLLLRTQGEIVNKIMISLMEIYYPSNFGLGITSDDIAAEKNGKTPAHHIRWMKK